MEYFFLLVLDQIQLFERVTCMYVIIDTPPCEGAGAYSAYQHTCFQQAELCAVSYTPCTVALVDWIPCTNVQDSLPYCQRYT